MKNNFLFLVIFLTHSSAIFALGAKPDNLPKNCTKTPNGVIFDTNPPKNRNFLRLAYKQPATAYPIR